ncbi:transglutaminase family protein [Cereibacter sp. SYSU M97828]|nr:transglutaminase family protein [Cereibacter flavus]
MFIRFGYDITISCPQETTLVSRMAIRDERRPDLAQDEVIELSPGARRHEFVDGFGNRCLRIVAPPGDLRLRGDGLIRDDGFPDLVEPGAGETPIHQLPDDVMQFLLPSRYCESDELGNLAWSLFGHLPPGWARVQAICDHVNAGIAFNYQNASSFRTATGALRDGTGVCRDFAHTAIALCRAMSIPARYVNGYLGDIGVPYGGPMDFSAWFEAFLDGRWYAFDARHNVPRIGRIDIAYGRDAADVAMIHSFGPHLLKNFTVVCDEEAALAAQ